MKFNIVDRNQVRNINRSLFFCGGQMKTTRILIAVLILFSLVPQAFTPLPEVNSVSESSILPHTSPMLVTLTVVNNTSGLIYFVMDGTSKRGETKIYKYSGYAGRNTYRVEQGVYVTTFWGCGWRQSAKKLQMLTNRKVTLKCGAVNDPESSVTIR